MKAFYRMYTVFSGEALTMAGFHRYESELDPAPIMAKLRALQEAWR